MTKFQTYFTIATKTMGFIFAGFVLAHWLTAGHDNIIEPYDPTPDSVMDIREHAPKSPAGVLSAHKNECWGPMDEPMAELPGAAIVQFNDGTTIYTSKHRLVDAAFNEALAHAGYGEKTSDEIDTIALCI